MNYKEKAEQFLKEKGMERNSFTVPMLEDFANFLDQEKPQEECGYKHCQYCPLRSSKSQDPFKVELISEVGQNPTVRRKLNEIINYLNSNL